MPRLIDRKHPHPKAIASLFWYDPRTGDVGRYRKDGSRKAAINTINRQSLGAARSAGRVNGIRCQFLFSGKVRCFLAHQIAYCLVTGRWPVGDIDHIDRNPLNNAWRNLRHVSPSTNARNLPQSGVKRIGQYWRVGQSRDSDERYFKRYDEAWHAAQHRKRLRLAEALTMEKGRRLSEAMNRQKVASKRSLAACGAI